LPLAFCNWWLLRTEFSFHREPFALKSFYSPTDNSRMATEAFVKAATVLQLGRSIARHGSSSPLSPNRHPAPMSTDYPPKGILNLL
jgi:hypothetical protein